MHGIGHEKTQKEGVNVDACDIMPHVCHEMPFHRCATLRNASEMHASCARHETLLHCYAMLRYAIHLRCMLHGRHEMPLRTHILPPPGQSTMGDPRTPGVNPWTNQVERHQQT
jgi:hypothetical protein